MQPYDWNPIARAKNNTKCNVETWYSLRGVLKRNYALLFKLLLLHILPHITNFGSIASAHARVGVLWHVYISLPVIPAIKDVIISPTIALSIPIEMVINKTTIMDYEHRVSSISTGTIVPMKTMHRQISLSGSSVSEIRNKIVWL